MTHILYEGRPLKSRERLIWTVIVWDENGLPGEPSESFFEMGLLELGDWKASWIAGDVALKKHKRYPADCFCKTFRLSKQVKRARLYITACGLYEAMLNGNRVGEFALAPGCTDYRKRLQYQTYDVTGGWRGPTAGGAAGRRLVQRICGMLWADEPLWPTDEITVSAGGLLCGRRQ